MEYRQPAVRTGFVGLSGNQAINQKSQVETLAIIDVLIGSKIKTIRKGGGISQIELAEKIGISFQQIQKYEKGATRLSVFRLLQISEALGVDITFFFEDRKSTSQLQVAGPTIEYGGKSPVHPQPFIDKEGMTFLKLFRRIKNKKIKQGLLKQLRGIVELEKKTAPDKQ